mgnify:CR=1 FL=1
MNKNSIIKKVVVAVTIPLLLQVILFIVMILGTGMIPAMKENRINSFRESGNDKHRYIQDQMLQNWSSINRETKNINRRILNKLEEKGLSTSELNRNVDLSNEIYFKTYLKFSHRKLHNGYFYRIRYKRRRARKFNVCQERRHLY